MATINLLPWREQLRETQKRKFIVALVFASVVSALGIVFIHMRIAYLISEQQARNAYLTKNIARLDQQIQKIKDYPLQKEKIATRMQIIYTLNRERSQLVHLMHEWVKTVPPGIYLTTVNRKGEQLNLMGRAESNILISQLMRNLTASKWVHNPTLSKIEMDQTKLPHRSEFELHVAQQAKNLLSNDTPLPASQRHNDGA
jgi:type IV pilus assembly protein PilN